MRVSAITCLLVFTQPSLHEHHMEGTYYTRSLYEYLFHKYNRLSRPVKNNSQVVTVKFKLGLSQLFDVEWVDENLLWNPDDFDGITMLHVPPDYIWLPGLVLYNNADGNYEVSIMTKANLYWNGTIVWEPPAVFNSMCQIDILWFPLDYQFCELTFGSWKYDGFELDLVYFDEDLSYISELEIKGSKVQRVSEGIDLSDAYPSVEWDIMWAPSERYVTWYNCCQAPYIAISFGLYLRRQPLFYTINLIIPCLAISCLTVLVFCLPSHSGEKVSLCISVLISLTVFFLLLYMIPLELFLLVEIIPSTSEAMPLIGRYLLFTMVLVTLSIMVTVITLNIHYRSTSTHTMSSFVRKTFLGWLPKVLGMSRNLDYLDKSLYLVPKLQATETAETRVLRKVHQETKYDYISPFDTPTVKLSEDWRFVASVMDRLFLLIFLTTCTVGTGFIILQAPFMYDYREPIDLWNGVVL